MAQPSVASIVNAATEEWTHWGKSTWNCLTGKKSKGHHTDDELTFAQYVIDNYLPPIYKAPIKWPTPTAISEDIYYWSAVAISHMMLKAGFTRKRLVSSKATPVEYAAWVEATTPGEFPASESHSDFIRWSIRARRDSITSAAYWGFRVDEPQAVPEVGDLIGYARPSGAATHNKILAYFDRTSGYSSHTDIVIEKRAGEIDVIGGNVRDSVTLKTLAIDAKGALIDQKHGWFVVMKRR